MGSSYSTHGEVKFSIMGFFESEELLNLLNLKVAICRNSSEVPFSAFFPRHSQFLLVDRIEMLFLNPFFHLQQFSVTVLYIDRSGGSITSAVAFWNGLFTGS